MTIRERVLVEISIQHRLLPGGQKIGTVGGGYDRVIGLFVSFGAPNEVRIVDFHFHKATENTAIVLSHYGRCVRTEHAG